MKNAVWSISGPVAWLLVCGWMSAAGAGICRAQSVMSDLGRAQAFLDRSDARSALVVIREAKSRPGITAHERANVLRLEGYVLVLLRRDAEAEETFRALLRLVPDDVYGHLELAKRLHVRAAYEEARRHYQLVLAKNPEHREATESLQNLVKEQKNHAEVATRIQAGERNIKWAAGLAVLVLLVFGWLLRRLLGP